MIKISLQALIRFLVAHKVLFTIEQYKGDPKILEFKTSERELSEGFCFSKLYSDLLIQDRRNSFRDGIGTLLYYHLDDAEIIASTLKWITLLKQLKSSGANNNDGNKNTKQMELQLH